ncbi:hypothetical protein [Oligoflexus tunisiensis]|uniref:hypothetical protein n=1 Tax=Oligoflexus tunisiensis TaxID=708132 RepID=UPI00114C9106|nr:hypothetical protein [Oligoflexus tunisiensis]
MSEIKTTLDTLSDPGFQKREFLFERVGWACMGIILLAASLGVFGKGVLSQAELRGKQFHLQYDRFLHRHDLTTLKLEIPPIHGEPGVIAVAFPNTYLHKFRIEHITPAPESSAHGDQTLFWFTATHTGEPTTILWSLEPQEMGRLEGRIFVNGAEGYAFRQFVYP